MTSCCFVVSVNGPLERTYFKRTALCLFQCGVSLDQPVGCGRGAGRFGTGSFGPGSFSDQRGPGGALPDRGRGGRGGHRRHSHQLSRRETEDAPARRLSGRPAGPHLCGI